MRYYRLRSESTPRLVVEMHGSLYNLTSVKRGVSSFRDIVEAADLTGHSVDEIAERLVGDAETLAEADLEESATLPAIPDEIWAAGVTYKISEEAREAESNRPEIYYDVYEADRPELFFKATPSRTVGPGEKIGIRGDSTWNVPEPELAVVIYEGQIVGFTVGNDVSSRDLEGENPLYLPQAKVYDRSAAIGPCIATPASVGDPHDLTLSLEIHRNGSPVVDDETTTGEMVRTCEELTAAYLAHNVVPDFAVLMTGTSLVPDDDFTLQEGDIVEISIESIGTLRNEVTVV